MRGKEGLRGVLGLGMGITPAYAGKRGWIAVVVFYEPGSPPRMRGKVPLPLLPLPGLGITPAYAGKSHVTTPCGLQT